MEKREKRRRDGMGKGKKESSSCCSPHNMSGGGGGLRRREAYELRSRAARTRSGLIRVRNASPPSKIPNPRHAPKNLGDSRLQVPLPRPEQMENENMESERINLDDYESFQRGMNRVLTHLSLGGTDVERVKRELGVTDETLRKHGIPANLEEYRQSKRQLASPYIQACFAKLNQTTNQDDDLELLDVLFLFSEMPYGSVFHHMHFRAIRKSKTDPGHESPGLYCAVFFPLTGNECRVIGCVLLQNDCPGDSQGRNSAKCLYSRANSANIIEEALEYASEYASVGWQKDPREYAGDSQGRNSGKCLHFAGNSANTIEEAFEYASGGRKCCYEIGELSPHNYSAREIPGGSFWEQYRQSKRLLASPYIQACFAKLNQTTNPDDDLELLDVLFHFSEMPYGRVFHHMHFRAIRKSKADPGHESPGLYCAVLFPLTGNECHVIGCVLLQNDCPGDSQGRNFGECLLFEGNSANTIEEVFEYASDGRYKTPHKYVAGCKCCYEIGELSPHNDSARELQGSTKESRRLTSVVLNDNDWKNRLASQFSNDRGQESWQQRGKSDCGWEDCSSGERWCGC